MQAFSELVYIVPFVVAIALIFVLADAPPTRVHGRHVDFSSTGAHYIDAMFAAASWRAGTRVRSRCSAANTRTSRSSTTSS